MEKKTYVIAIEEKGKVWYYMGIKNLLAGTPSSRIDACWRYDTLKGAKIALANAKKYVSTEVNVYIKEVTC